jgi:hypothetical protein
MAFQFAVEKVTQLSSSVVSFKKTYVDQSIEVTNFYLKLLQHHKFSTFIQTFRVQFIDILKSGKLELSGQSIEFNPNFVKYFKMGCSDKPFEDFLSEPSEIVRIKKTINAIYSLEQFLTELEQIPSLSFTSSSSIIFSIRSRARALFVEVLNLNAEYENLFSAHSNTCSMLMIESLKILNVIHGGFSGDENQWPLLKSGLSTFSNRIDRLKQSFNGADVAACFGRAFGLGVHLCAPDNKDSKSIGHIISLFPNLLRDMSLKIQQVTHFLASTHGNLNASQVKDLQRQTDVFLNRLNQLASQSDGFSLNIVSLIYNCRKIYNIAQDIVANLGQLQQSSQHLFKENLHELKFNFILGVITTLDAVEIDMFLKPGSLTYQLLPYLENCYWSFLNVFRPYIDFAENEQNLLHLLEPSWQQARINAVSVRQSEAFIRRQDLQQQYDFYQHINSCFQDIEHCSLENIKIYFTALADYIKRIDDVWYNQILHDLQIGNFNSEFDFGLFHFDNLSQLGVLIQQKMSSQDLFLRNLSILHERLISEEQQHVSYFLETPELNYSYIATRLYAESALVRYRQQFYWFNRQDLSLIHVPLNLSLQELITKDVSPNFLFGLDQRVADYFSDYTNQYVLNSSAFIRKKINQTEVIVRELDDFETSELEALIKRSYVFLNDLTHSQEAFTTFFSKLHYYLTFGQGAGAIRPQWHAELVRYYKLFAHEIPSNIIIDWSSVRACFDSVSELEQQLIAYFLQQTQLEKQRLEDYTQQYFQKSKQDLSAQYEALSPLPRVGYYVRSTYASEFFNGLEKKLMGLLKFYSPVTVPYLQKEEHGCYQDLLDTNNISGEAKQLVEQKIIFNLVFLFKQFFTHIEKQKVSEMQESVMNLFTFGVWDLLGNKLDLIAYYFQCQNYLLWELGTKYHLSLINQHIQQFLSFNQHVKNELKQHELRHMSDDIKIDSIDQFIHWFFSAPQLIEHYANGQAYLIDEQAHLQLSARLKGIILNSDSWLLLIKIPHIYQVFTAFKQKWHELTSNIHHANHQHLAKMKFELVKHFMQSVDELEADLGLNPIYFSNQVMQFIDVLFEHFYMSLKLDLYTYKQLMLDKRLPQYRLTTFEEKMQNSQLQEKYHRLNFAKLKHFNHMLAQFMLIDKSYSEKSEQNVRRILFSSFKDVLPLLIQHAPDRGDVKPAELRTSSEVFWDELFNKWIGEIGCDEEFAPNCVQQLSYVTQKYYEGLCKTESLKKDLYQHKTQCVEADVNIDVEQHLQQYTKLYYENFCQDIITKRALMFGKINPLYIKTLKEFFVGNRQQIIDKVVNQMSSQRMGVDENVSIQVYFLQEFQRLVSQFDQTYHQQFSKLESVHFAVERFYDYQSNIARQLQMNQIDIFESEDTLQVKKELFVHIDEVASADLTVEERLQQIKDYVEQQSFQNNMLNYHHHLPTVDFWQSTWGAIFSQIYLYVKQIFLLGLAKIGLYQPTYQSCLQSVQDAVKSSKESLPDISQYSLFQGLTKPALNVISCQVAQIPC